MYNILTLNKISELGLDKFSDRYLYGDDIAAPDAVMVRSASMHDMELAPETVAVARCGAGTNNIPSDKFAKSGVVVFNTPGANANSVKELVICAMLLASRKIIPGIEWCVDLKCGCGETGVSKAVEKGKSAFVGPELKGKTLGIVGLGAIGRLVGEAAAALGMSVIGYDPFTTGGNGTQIKIVGGIDEVFAESDYISLHAPGTAQTKNMINKDTLKLMKDGVRIINFARGDLVNSADILEALKSGKAAAYATDFPTEEQLGVDGVIAIPHLGASTPESEDNCAAMAADELMLYLETGAIKNSVNFQEAPLSDDFAERTCVFSSSGAAAAVKSILGETVFSAEQNGIVYTVADKAADKAALEAVDGVIRVRLLSKSS